MRCSSLLLLLALITPTAFAAPADDLRQQGQALLREGKLDDAVDVLEQAVELAPKDAAAHHLLGAAYGRKACAGSLFAKMRLAGDVKEHFERAVELAPDEVEYRESLIQFYAQAPAVAGGGIDKARVQAAEIGKRDAVRGKLAEGLIARIEGKPEQALTIYREAYAQRPDDARLGVQLGLYLQELKRWDEAFGQFQLVVSRTPAAMPAWYQVGRTAVLANVRHAEGEAALKRYLAWTPTAQDPPLAAAHWRLGMLYEQMKKTAEARAQYQAALALDPEHAEAKAALRKLKA
jgi:tetratricopeptide (TPR) repeat protein